MQTSTDLTIYQVSEIKNETDKSVTFKLVQKSLEVRPFEQCCPHAHASVTEASKCNFFTMPKNTLEALPQLAAA